MSFRTYVNDVPIFGNNQFYKEWNEFLQRNGILPDDDGLYDGYITDFSGALETIEKIVMNIESVNESYGFPSLFDITMVKRNIITGEKLLDEIFDIINQHNLFLPYKFYLSCKSMLDEEDVLNWDGQRYHRFHLKKGCKIHVYCR